MKRFSALMLTATLFLIWGCGTDSYERRLDHTLEAMRYRQQLDANLAEAPTDKQFKDFPMYVRPPKDMTLAKQFMLVADLPAGSYDVAASFTSTGKDGSDRKLHVLGRKKAAAKKKAKNAPPEAEVPRGPFDQDVLALLGSVYGADAVASPKFQEELKKGNKFRRMIFTASNGNVVRVYILKKDPHDAALIFDNPAAQDKDSSYTKARDLTLQCFGIGKRAESAFGGVLTEGEQPPGAGGEESATPF